MLKAYDSKVPIKLHASPQVAASATQVNYVVKRQSCVYAHFTIGYVIEPSISTRMLFD